MTPPIADHSGAQGHRSSGWRFDRTLNIPTIATVLAMFISVVGFAINANSKADEALRQVQEVKAAQVAQSTAASTQTSALRTEIRADLRDVNQKLDQLMFRLGGQANMKEWTR
ncbi:hypothetical protein [Orrella dioscoreae]|uniref:Uncharacterized protein n=1 Tax=Orrella dioscoreae TaxID=1851544 RepID=A0A1C3K1Q1_9BURK|nr:hypothetical protein [Orrella dioscoreae]SBT25338.1 hypothetical protein ODI_03641 [Orrella dioscoreae]SOE49135.1 hypothetical protein ODI_R1864 [Orrella dioscoreae]